MVEVLIIATGLLIAALTVITAHDFNASAIFAWDRFEENPSMRHGIAGLIRMETCALLVPYVVLFAVIVVLLKHTIVTDVASAAFIVLGYLFLKAQYRKQQQVATVLNGQLLDFRCSPIMRAMIRKVG